MTIYGEELGPTPFWVPRFQNEGDIFRIGVSVGNVSVTVGNTDSSTYTIQGSQRHFYAEPEGNNVPLDYDWDTGMLHIMVLEPIDEVLPNLLSRCFEKVLPLIKPCSYSNVETGFSCETIHLHRIEKRSCI